MSNRILYYLTHIYVISRNNRIEQHCSVLDHIVDMGGRYQLGTNETIPSFPIPAQLRIRKINGLIVPFDFPVCARPTQGLNYHFQVKVLVHVLHELIIIGRIINLIIGIDALFVVWNCFLSDLNNVVLGLFSIDIKFLDNRYHCSFWLFSKFMSTPLDYHGCHFSTEGLVRLKASFGNQGFANKHRMKPLCGFFTSKMFLVKSLSGFGTFSSLPFRRYDE